MKTWWRWWGDNIEIWEGDQWECLTARAIAQGFPNNETDFLTEQLWAIKEGYAESPKV